MTSDLFRAWAASDWEPVPTLLMAFAALGWLRGSARLRTDSDALELTLACATLNAVALTYWCVARDDARAFVDWSVHALASGALILLLSLPRLGARRGAIATLGPAAGYVGVALLVTLMSVAR